MASLIKIPFLLAMTTTVHRAINPPSTASKKEAYVPKNVNWRTAEFALGIVFSMFPTINAIYWIVTIAECAIILASNFPSFLLSQSIISYLSFTGSHLSRIQATPTFFISCAVGTLGCVLRLLCYREMGKMFTFELAQREDHKLITTGPYSIVRHPSYAGSVLAFTGSAVCLFGRNSWMMESGALSTAGGLLVAGFWMSGLSVLTVILVGIRVREEDVMLKHTFGSTWDDWAKEVPYRLIPGVY